jgi:hypothetical protein
MVDYFNPSSRINLPSKNRENKMLTVYCGCGGMMTYDPLTDVFGCQKCGLRCTPQGLTSFMRKRFK